MRKLIGWEVIMTALTLLSYAVCMNFGMKPHEAVAVFAAVTVSAAFVAFAAVFVAAFVASAAVAVSATFVTVAAAAFVAVFVSDALKLRYRSVFLSLVIEMAVIFTGLTYGSHLFA